MSEKNEEGWTWLHNAPKWHYFRNQQSLCGRWMAFDTDFEEGKDDHPDNCKACQRKRLAELSKRQRI